MSNKTNIMIGKNAPSWLSDMLTDMAGKGELGGTNITNLGDKTPDIEAARNIQSKLNQSNQGENKSSTGISLGTILSFVQSEFMNRNGIKAVIAGGLPRDMLFDKEPGDVDIFISTQTMTCIAEAAIEVSKFCLKHDLKMETTNNYFGDGKGYIRIKAKGLSDYCIDFCLVPSFSDGKELVSNFDLVICQAWLEASGDSFEIRTTELFREMSERKLLGYYPSRISDGHLEKISKKYPDYLPIALSEKQSKEQTCSEDIPF